MNCIDRSNTKHSVSIWRSGDRASWQILIIKPTRCTNFSNLFFELRFRPDPTRELSANLYDIYHCCVYSGKTPDDGQRNCPKHVEFYSKNKYEKISASSWFCYKNSVSTDFNLIRRFILLCAIPVHYSHLSDKVQSNLIFDGAHRTPSEGGMGTKCKKSYIRSCYMLWAKTTLSYQLQWNTNTIMTHSHTSQPVSKC